MIDILGISLFARRTPDSISFFFFFSGGNFLGRNTYHLEKSRRVEKKTKKKKLVPLFFS